MKNNTDSKVLTGSGQVTLYPGKIYDITVTGAAAANSVSLKNNSTDGSGGTVIWDCAFTPTFVDTREYTFPEGKSFTTNCYATIANATSVCFSFKDNS